MTLPLIFAPSDQEKNLKLFWHNLEPISLDSDFATDVRIRRKNMGEFLQQLSQPLQLNQLISEHLSDIKELIIVPHLFLHQIPFAALPVDIQPTPGRY